MHRLHPVAAFALSLLAGCASLADEELPSSSPPAPAPEIPAPPSPAPRVYALSDESPPLVPGAPLLIQEARPDGCAGTDQPGIMDFTAADAGQDVAVWACFEGCGPGLEYLTSVHRHRGRTSLTVKCTPICAANEHRRSYATIEGAASCAPDAPPPAVAASLAREQTRERAAYVEARARQLLVIGGLIASCEKAPRPWDDATISAWTVARHELGELFEGSDGRPAARTREESVRWEAQKHDLKAANPALMQATHAQASKLSDRLERLRPALDLANHRRDVERAQRACTASCDERRPYCLRTCEGLGDAVCATCEIEHAACVNRCASRN